MSQKSFFFSRSFGIPMRFVVLIWMVFFFEMAFHVNLGILGIYPRTLFGLAGILFAPLVHGDMLHLVSNTFPILFLGTALYMFYDRIAGRVFFHCYFFTGILVWVFARPAIHIGASGLIYGLAFFFIFFGIFRKDFKSILLALVVVFLYGGIFYGILPTTPGISWESHLMGGIVGTISAWYYSEMKRV